MTEPAKASTLGLQSKPARDTMYWRLCRTRLGRRIIKEQLDALDPLTRASVAAAMKDVEARGIYQASSPVRGEIREIDADGPDHTTYRLLFARDGHLKQILLGLVFFEKKTQKTPPQHIDQAERRLADWREGARGAREAEEAKKRKSQRR